MRLIDADAFKEWLMENSINERERDESREIGIWIDAFPSAEPERKKGRWYKPTGMMPPEYAGRHRCSECDGFAMHDWKTHREVLTDYCPWCGADMRGEQE